jgi:hypothetical protein
MESGQVIGREVPLPFWRRAMPLLLGAIGGIWLIGLGVRSQVSGERLWLIGADVDLGKVKRNQVISHRVWVFNPSLRLVAIEATPSCGCTVVELPLSAVDAVERFSCGGAGWDLGFAVGLSGEGGGLECLFGWGALARAGGGSAGSGGLMSPNGCRERLILWRWTEDASNDWTHNRDWNSRYPDRADAHFSGTFGGCLRQQAERLFNGSCSTLSRTSPKSGHSRYDM